MQKVERVVKMISSSIILLIFCSRSTVMGSETTLEMVHLVFRHGDRTPTTSEIEYYPNYEEANNTWSPFGKGQLTNKGVLRMFKLGEIIRQKYGDLILSGSSVNDAVKTYTSESDRAKASALAFLAGLLTPTTELQWGTKKKCITKTKDCGREPQLSTLWRPTIFISDASVDNAINIWYKSKGFLDELARVQSSIEVQEKMSNYNKTIPILLKNSGREDINPYLVYGLRNLYTCQEAAGLAKPKWVEENWSEIDEITNLFFDLVFSNDELKRFGTGDMLKRILEDSQDKANDTERLKSTKMLVYSAHDMITVGLHAALGGEEGFKDKRGLTSPAGIPEFSAALAIELHRSVSTGEYGFKFLYSNGDGVFKSLRRSDCADPCPLEDLIRLTRHLTYKASDIGENEA